MTLLKCAYESFDVDIDEFVTIMIDSNPPEYNEYQIHQRLSTAGFYNDQISGVVERLRDKYLVIQSSVNTRMVIIPYVIIYGIY